MAKRSEKEDAASVGTPAVLTGHTTEAHVVKDANGKTQSVHSTTVITDPNDPLAVQGHDDPRVNGTLADPLKQEPSPNDLADGADVPESASASHVVVGEADEDAKAAGQPATDSKTVADSDSK